MQIKIHQEGWIYFIVSSILTIISFPFFPFIGLFFLILSAFIFYFFRDPIRIVPAEDVIVSPADGLITFIGKSKAVTITGALTVITVHGSSKVEILITSKKTQSLYLRFDGNVVHMRGMWFSVNKFKKQLKLLELF